MLRSWQQPLCPCLGTTLFAVRLSMPKRHSFRWVNLDRFDRKITTRPLETVYGSLVSRVCRWNGFSMFTRKRGINLTNISRRNGRHENYRLRRIIVSDENETLSFSPDPFVENTSYYGPIDIQAKYTGTHLRFPRVIQIVFIFIVDARRPCVRIISDRTRDTRLDVN